MNHRPAFRHEVRPALSLIDPNNPWIPVILLNGTSSSMDLKTLLLESHNVRTFTLNSSPATLALYRIMLSIIYSIQAESQKTTEPEFGFEDQPSKLWFSTIGRKITDNKGLTPENVENYFSLYADRFYLIHPDFPFMQDATLYKTSTQTIFDLYQNNFSIFEEDSKELKTLKREWKNQMKSISSAYSKAINKTTQGNPKSVWGLPPEDVYNAEDFQSTNTLILMTMLLEQLYSHSATGRGSRVLYSSLDTGTTASDDYPPAHALRCAVGYVIQGESLYTTLLGAMDFFDSDHPNFHEDIPEWERAVDPLTGTVVLKGYNVSYYELVAGSVNVLKDVDGLRRSLPRSSVNLTHLSILIVPAVDEEGKMLPNGGQVKQIRRPLFNFKHEKTDETKMSSPLTWNPFIAQKNDKAFKLISAIAPTQLLSNAELLRIPFLQNFKKSQEKKSGSPTNKEKAITIVAPFMVQNLNDQASINNVTRSLRLLIFSGDPSKEKTFSDFIVQTPDFSIYGTHDEKISLDRWFEAGREIENKLAYSVGSYATSKEISEQMDIGKRSGISERFWEQYQTLFFSVNQNEVVTVTDQKKAIKAMCLTLFEHYSKGYASAQPFLTAKKSSTLANSINNILEGRVIIS